MIKPSRVSLGLTLAMLLAAGSSWAGTVHIPPASARLHDNHASLACRDCHNERSPCQESARVRAQNPACMSCHQGKSPSMPAKMRSSGKHPPLPAGSDCSECHKSATTTASR